MQQPEHEHEWDPVAQDDGHILTRCACGQERLLAGTTLHGRKDELSDWLTPAFWNIGIPQGA